MTQVSNTYSFFCHHHHQQFPLGQLEGLALKGQVQKLANKAMGVENAGDRGISSASMCQATVDASTEADERHLAWRNAYLHVLCSLGPSQSGILRKGYGLP